jgi:hypothetical protein
MTIDQHQLDKHGPSGAMCLSTSIINVYIGDDIGNSKQRIFNRVIFGTNVTHVLLQLCRKKNWSLLVHVFFAFSTCILITTTVQTRHHRLIVYHFDTYAVMCAEITSKLVFWTFCVRQIFRIIRFSLVFYSKFCRNCLVNL